MKIIFPDERNRAQEHVPKMEQEVYDAWIQYHATVDGIAKDFLQDTNAAFTAGLAADRL